MSWNYRIIKEGSNFSIRAVYYENNIPHSWSDSPEDIVAESVEELKEYLGLYIKALDKPILEVERSERLLEIKD